MGAALSPKTAAGRKAICQLIADVAGAQGASVRVIPHWPSEPSREAMVRIAYGPVEVGIVVGPQKHKHGYCLPWHMNALYSDARMTYAFSAAARAPVNRFHKRKCTAFYPDLSETLEALERTLRAIADGSALETVATTEGAQ